ncbi:Undecaprenyl-phosphate 4-deoxy-4-formamido-L-arabinose transferase [subsurface metagenome]
MPAYNEGDCIFENIRMTREVMLDAGISAEIVAVDDGSSDNTLREIRRAAEAFDNVIEVRNPYNMGKGMALRSGFERSTGEIVVFLDADLDLHPSQIRKLVDVLEDTPCDVVVTSKHHPESHLQYPFSRTIASWVYYLMIKTLFNLPVRDTQTGLKVFRRKVLDDVLYRLLVKKFAYDVELLATAVRFGYKVHEVPAVLDFKRDLKWGRIRFEDVLSLFIDTLAVFYRLRIMRYYDGDRPRPGHVEKPVLIIVRSYPPPEEVIRRITNDSRIRIVCISKDIQGDEKPGDMLLFQNEELFISWLDEVTDTVEIAGFLGRGCLPVGSWVNYAVRNFDDPAVGAVCGPIIPGSFTSFLEKASGMVFSSIITSGSNAYLYSFRPVQDAGKGSMDNVFLRTELLRGKSSERNVLTLTDRFVCLSAGSKMIMRYDPDVAVIKKVPSLFIPYIRTLAREALSDGYTGLEMKDNCSVGWSLVFTAIWMFLIAGWLIVPLNVYLVLCLVYAAVVILTALSCMNPLIVPFFALGIFCNHFVRAFAFPAGIIKRFLEHRRHDG